VNRDSGTDSANGDLLGHWLNFADKLNIKRNENNMNYPTTIYADTDLVCGEEPKEGHQKYVRCDDNELAADARLASVDAAMERKLKSDEEIESLLAAVNNLVEIVEGVRNVRWNYDGFRLKDTPEWCALYSAWSNQGASPAKADGKA
jgi:hypothetical protein